MPRKDKRKKAVVDARIQWTLASRVVMHFCLFIICGALLGLVAQFLTDPFRGVDHHLRAFWSNNGPYLVTMLCLLPIFVRDTLTLSNRVVGPICRLRHTIKSLAQGQSVPPLKFRKGDLWDDLPDSFNRMVARLQNPATETESMDPPTSETCLSAPQPEPLEV